MPVNESKSSFRRLHKFQSEYSPNTFTQYESENTGMRVVIVDQKGPKVHGYFVLATEIHDDSGAPHTLEHLCFMGSRNYQYKGVLDKLATRLYSDTNAWTATDHTAYTLETAGWEGFGLILPIYLEHIIAPTLTDAGCYTEVYHVDGAGNDAGVVYSEMQGVQNTSSELIDLKARRLVYPEGVGFRYETGGMMEQLRVLTAERIREFHREMYQPKNLCLVITGEVDHGNLLSILDQFEETILDVIPAPDAPFTRPFTKSLAPALEKSVVEVVEFPEADESFGEIEIRFLGPGCNDPVQTAALNVALLYLAGSSAALLEYTLVEKEQVATAVYYSTDDRPRIDIRFTLTSVATESLANVEKRFFEVLKEAVSKELDMKYMQECIERHRRNWKFAAENSVSSLADYVISDFLFGLKDGKTLLHLGSLREYDELMKWNESQWRGYIKHWIADAPHVSVLGTPSKKFSQKQKADEKERIKERKEKLGEKGLEDLARKLKEAQAENDKEIPREILAGIKVPDTDSIHFITTTTGRSGLALKAGRPENKIQKLIDSDGSTLPLFLHFEHIASNFVQFSVMISTQGIPVELLPLLSVYTEYFFSAPVSRNGETIPFDRVIVELERDTVGYIMDTAPVNSEMLAVTFQVELEKYEAAISWLKELSWQSIFDTDRLVAVTTRLYSDVPDLKRSGSSMLDAVRSMVQFAPESLTRARSVLVKALYLKRIKKMLAKSPEEVVQRMEEIRKYLFKAENLRILVVGDLERLPNPVSTWKPFIDGLDTSKPLQPVVRKSDRLSEAGKNPGNVAYIVPMSTVDSSYSMTSVKGPSSYDDPRIPALTVALAYMNAVEGPLWVAVRGTGLAYGASFRSNIDTGLVHLTIYRSPNACKAFLAAKKVVEDHLSGEAEFDPLMSLEGAVSTVVASFANEQATYFNAAQESFLRQVIRELPSDYKETLLKKVKAITIEDIKTALRDIIMPLFTPGKADTVITCTPVLEQTLKTDLESQGFKPEVKQLSDFEEDYGLPPVEGEEDEESEESDEEDGPYESGESSDEE